jgi:hypothetical protein
MPHAIGNAEMGALLAEWSSIVVSFDLGTTGEVREPFLDSSESSDLVQKISLRAIRPNGYWN